jgi:GT2 family glycosyltransferase
LESIYKLEYTNFQILLIDNSLTQISVNSIINWAKGTLPVENSLFPKLLEPFVLKPISYIYVDEDNLDLTLNYAERLVLIKANKNKGFAAGNNIALRAINNIKDNCFIWLLNNDTIVKADTLSQLVDYYDNSDIKPGIIGNKLFYYYNEDKLNGIGGTYNKWLGISNHMGESEIDSGQYDHIDYNKSVQYVIGASMFISKAFLADVGILNEDYFLFFEEIDWVQRSKVNNWKLGFAPKSVLFHKESASISPEAEKSILFETSFLSSKLIFTIKYFKRALPLIYLTIIWMLFNRLRRKQFNKLMPIVKVAINPFGYKNYIIKKLNT